MKITNEVKIIKSPGQVKDIIKKVVSIAGLNQSIYLEGPSGIGKTEIVTQLAKELDCELIDIRLGNYDVVDLNGIGIPDLDNHKAIFTRPEFYPPENSDKKYLIFLDEFNHATEAVFGLAYQLVLERRVNTHILPNNVLIIGAGNRVDDKGISFQMPSPLVNRFMKINVEPSINDWIKYAETQGVDWKILGFLKGQSEYLHKFDGKTAEDNFPTPRNWIKFDTYKEHFEDIEFMEVILNSLFGMSVMVQFKEYLKLVDKLPHLEAILEGDLKRIKTITDISSSYAFYMLVRNYLKNNKDKMTSTNYMNLFNYNDIQPNKEIMQLLNTEIISFINKEYTKEVKEELQYVIHSNMDKLKENKEFVGKLTNFSKSIKTKG